MLLIKLGFELTAESFMFAAHAVSENRSFHVTLNTPLIVALILYPLSCILYLVPHTSPCTGARGKKFVGITPQILG